MKKLKSTLLNLFYYIIIITFFLPKGIAEFNSSYSSILTLLIWISTFIIFLYYFLYYHKKEKIIQNNKNIFYYFIYILIITFILRGIYIDGLQKILCYPAIFLFYICSLRDDPSKVINITCNVLLVNFILNLFVLKDFFDAQFHITFLGHVQLISQIGLLSIFCAFLSIIISRKIGIRNILLIVLSLYTMVKADATVSVISFIVLILFGLIYLFKLHRLFMLNSKTYVYFGFILSLLIIIFSVYNNLYNNNSIRFIDFNGRSFIWVELINNIKNHIIFGYGIEGIKIKVFWSAWTNVNGFNYAHNQIIQNLIDGGIISLLLFWKMIINCTKNIKKINNKNAIFLFNITLLIFLIIMVVESVSLYYYFYIFLAFAFNSDFIIKMMKGDCNNGND